MTIQQAMTKAMQFFDHNRPDASIRRVSLSEGTGNWRIDRLTYALIHIEYAVGDDYTESDNHPCYIRVHDENGKPVIG